MADRNAPWLGRECAERGWVLDEVRVVDDTVETIARTVRELLDPDRLLVLTGGLGPTTDDLTREAIAVAAGVGMEEREDARLRLERFFADRGREMDPSNLRQTRFPEGSTVLPTRWGTADGLSMAIGGAPVVSFPGVPYEFREMASEVLPTLLESGPPGPRSTIVLVGAGESALAGVVERTPVPDGTAIAYTASHPHVRVTLRAPDAAVVEAAERRLREALQPWALDAGADTVGEAFCQALHSRGLRVATAESCTGGAIASAITDVPGASSRFEYGWVTYANAAKVTSLGVEAGVLERVGAVSAEVAAAMARGARVRADADVAIAVSGIAGPTGGSEEKPVGLVYLSVATETAGVVVKAHLRALERPAFKRAVTALALLSALRVVEGRPDDLNAAHGVLWCRPIEEYPA